MKSLGKVGLFLVHAVGYYLLGAVIILVIGALSEILPSYYNSDEVWKIVSANLIIGFAAAYFYNSLPKAKED